MTAKRASGPRPEGGRGTPSLSTRKVPAARYVEANGIRFGYFEAGQGPLVLCLHGFPDTAHTFLATLEALAEKGFRAVSPFMRGYPPSSGPANGDYSILRLGEDVLALIPALGHHRAHVVGHDWGAVAAYVAANLGPERLGKLVTAAVPHLRVQRPIPAQLRRSWYIGFFQLPRVPEWRIRRQDFALIDRLWRAWSPGWRYTAADVAPVKEALATPEGLCAALGYYRALAGRASLDPLTRKVAFGRIGIPTLTFAGVDDGCMGIEMFENQAEGFTGPLEMIRMEGAGHFMHREDPAEFHQRLIRFLGDPAELR